MKSNKLPVGWTESRLKKVLVHYERQTPDEAVTEDETAINNKTQTFMEIPRKLVPSVRRLLARHTK